MPIIGCFIEVVRQISILVTSSLSLYASTIQLTTFFLSRLARQKTDNIHWKCSSVSEMLQHQWAGPTFSARWGGVSNSLAGDICIRQEGGVFKGRVCGSFDPPKKHVRGKSSGLARHDDDAVCLNFFIWWWCVMCHTHKWPVLFDYDQKKKKKNGFDFDAESLPECTYKKMHKTKYGGAFLDARWGLISPSDINVLKDTP
jgi:hypothetical protein